MIAGAHAQRCLSDAGRRVAQGTGERKGAHVCVLMLCMLMGVQRWFNLDHPSLTFPRHIKRHATSFHWVALPLSAAGVRRPPGALRLPASP